MTKEREPPEGGQSQEPTYLLTQAYDPHQEPDDQINLADYIRVLWRRRFLILLATLLCALTVYVVTVTTPLIYQARATLILQPPQFSTELKPAPLSVETLQAVLESDFIISKLKSQLFQENIIEPDTPLEGIKGMLLVQIYKG